MNCLWLVYWCDIDCDMYCRFMTLKMENRRFLNLKNGRGFLKKNI